MPHSAIARTTTVALIHQLRALAPPRRRRIGRIPRAIPPMAIERAYHDAIKRHVCDPARQHVAAVEHEIVRMLMALRRAQGREDAAPEQRMDGVAGGAGRASQLGKEAREKAERAARAKVGAVGHAIEQGKAARKLLDRAARNFTDEFHPHALHEVVRKFGERVDDHSRAQLDAQVRAAMGVPFSAIEKPVRDKLDGWAAENVDLIVTIPDRYFDRLRLDVEDAFATGMHPDTLAEDMTEDYEISINDARRIARDQIGSLNAEVTQERHKSLGVERYVWRAMRDNRTRDNHADLDGETFAYDDPPLGGGTSEDETGNPGEGILCRCFAEPVLDDIINGTEGEE